MSTIQRGDLDALGHRRRAPASALRAIARSIGNRTGRDRATIVTEEGCRLATGPAELRLEDGTSVTVEDVLPRDLPTGYHQIARRRSKPSALIVAPRTCYLPADLRTWGWAIQLYAARSARSWGIGDLADLRWLGQWESTQGAGMALKHEAPQAIWTASRQRANDPFDAFRHEMGGLREFATFCALAERFGGGWRSWPSEYRHPASAAVAGLARDRTIAERSRFHEWLQFELDRQPARAAAALPVMQDLPIGFDVVRLTRARAGTPLSEVIAHVHELLGRAPSRMLTATLDDAMAVGERPNMPATTDQWPNWRLSFPRPIETLAGNRLARRIARALRR